MGATTKIEWCDHTFNPWLGCQKVSPACDNCYAEKFVNTLGKGLKVEWGPGAPRKRTSPSNWKQPLRWNRQAEIKFNAWEKFKAENPGLTDTQLEAQGFVKPRRPRVFCGSLCDVFDNAVPDEWRVDLLKLILKTPHLNWLLLTKRIGNAMEMLDRAISTMSNGMAGWDGEEGFKHVWLGITVCNQEEADRDIPKLLGIPAAKRFLSIEPQLSDIVISEWLYTLPGIGWIIVGGETGAKTRPLHPAWVREIRDQCQEAIVPFFFKAWGEWMPLDDCSDWYENHHTSLPLRFYGNDGWTDEGDYHYEEEWMVRCGKERAGRLLDGREWLEVPE
jgi:protein gp37